MKGAVKLWAFYLFSDTDTENLKICENYGWQFEIQAPIKLIYM